MIARMVRQRLLLDRRPLWSKLLPLGYAGHDRLVGQQAYRDPAVANKRDKPRAHPPEQALTPVTHYSGLTPALFITLPQRSVSFLWYASNSAGLTPPVVMV